MQRQYPQTPLPCSSIPGGGGGFQLSLQTKAAQPEAEGHRQLLCGDRRVTLLTETPPPFLPSSQPPLNAQMLAQRQRELYSQQHRQRQLMQQRAILMRQQSFGSNLPPSSGLPVQIGAARLPQAPPQQFPYPPNYGTSPGNPPTSTSPFSPLASNPEAALGNRSGMVNRGMMGSVAGQFGAGMAPQMQQNIFPYSGSGRSSRWLPRKTIQWGGKERQRAEVRASRMLQPSPALPKASSQTISCKLQLCFLPPGGESPPE